MFEKLNFRGRLPIKNKPIIMLLGSYGQDNIGDKMMLEIMVSFLTKYDVDVVVNSTNPQWTQKLTGVNVFSTYLFKDIRKKFGYFVKSKAIIFGGGTIFIEHIDYHGKRNIRPILLSFITIVMAKVLNKKVCLFSVGIGILNSPISKFLTGIALKLSDLVIVRDKYSYRTARKYTRLNLQLGVDMVFIRKPRYVNLRNQGKALNIGITPCYWVRGNKEFRENFVTELVSSLNHLTSIFDDCKLTFVPFQSRWGKFNDMWLAKRMAKKLANTKGVTIKICDSTNKTLNSFRNFDLFIGVRLHSVIFAIINAVPFVALAYQKKVSSLVSDIGLSDLVVDVNTFKWSSLKSVIVNINKDKSKYIKNISSAARINNIKAQRMFAVLDSWVSANL